MADARVHEPCPHCRRSTPVYVDDGKRWCVRPHGCKGDRKVVRW